MLKVMNGTSVMNDEDNRTKRGFTASDSAPMSAARVDAPSSRRIK
jgi:hypothetical protein